MAYYDSYDYTSYWQGRDYEHESEVIAVREFLTKIKKIDRALEIGGGFGRLVPYYVFRTKQTILTDPSKSLLTIAKKKLHNFKNLKYQQSRVETLTKKFKKGSFDLILMIRVMHHLEDPDSTFEIINSLLEPGGYFILEFANKIHFKNVISHLKKGDFKFISDKGKIDIRSEKAKRKKMINFLNYHPSVIRKSLENAGFEIVETRSVSNVRSPYLKERLQKGVLLEFEKMLQKPLSYLYFGPSVFVLARKKG